MSSLSSRPFTVSLAEPAEAPRGARRVIIHADVLKTAKICAGDVLALSPLDPPAGAKTLYPLSAAAKLPRGLPSLRQAQEAGAVVLAEVPDISNQAVRLSDKTKASEKRKDWLSLFVRELLVDLKYLTPTQTVEVVYEGRRRQFTVSSVSSQSSRADNKGIADLTETLQSLSIDSPTQLWTVGWDTTVIVDEPKGKVVRSKSTSHKPEVETLPNVPIQDAYSSVGGLDKQISQIRDLLEIPLTRPDLFKHFGSPTHLARAIASSTRSSILVVNGPELSSAYHGETESKLRAVFADARAKAPCIVVLDEVDALCPRREDSAGGEVEKRVVATLLTIMDGIEGEDDEDGGRVVVVATTNRPNAIDPALRRPGRFDREIEIGIPDAEARSSILKVLLSKTPHSLTDSDIHTLASQAHGYVGADLSAAVREAGTLTIKRYLSSPSPPPTPPSLTFSDLLTALPTIRPSALRSLYLPTTPVYFSSIGGHKETIQKLRECVEWPMKHPEAFKRLGVRPVKGVLLYGPPGCAKTVLVRALACESGVNFVAVKGPELLSKFVGESERAVRDIFAKARAASPAIIFFDELDALATSRSSASSSNTNEGVLTSLLNEMDGVQELVGVTVVAATNRPEAIDSALMRPGRLDRILYVGPPDQSGREEILKIKIAGMSVEDGLDVCEIATLTEGCSGAEIASLCQEAAMLTMRRDLDAPFVPKNAFVSAAKVIKKQITPDVVRHFEEWSRLSGVAEV
ncbi:AAA-domain-containing protein [Gloeophyllum trabeum ATCC 11539]|uniref:AAA-domain-containing protein n=1 Tax=Gloeophyllum trabeum (strain ATCC 11539 / FP-39264 / Madison 617) TaxID=670483 RepID=S7RKH1_GLOTA|nr:AAA-domain-containing protein [Gloeophyllum trabeum ATCC 11539]EPQ54885.1 AAA-domain-containing protein [Gloeophyllum trabeum ATCC 11539]